MNEPRSLGQRAAFLDHLEANLGAITPIAESRPAVGDYGYTLLAAHLADPGVWSVVTDGVRLHRITSLLPEEFSCSLQDDQSHHARYLVDTTASQAVASGRGLDYDQVVLSDRPLLAGTDICGLLASPSPYFGATFDLQRDADGDPVLQVITLIPVTRAEAEFVEAADAEELYDIWREARTNLLNVHRESAL
ncbi:suppressor of fused domain protein [Nocardia sp. NPDC049149]|uniref:suppressor of fused domain protein n=1 Tax=Nocardia sp. NPDC049149 TaxID=3364315 RepID=UPI00371AF03D